MIKIDVTDKNIFQTKSEGYAFCVEQDFKISNEIQSWLSKAGVDFNVLAKQYKFTGKEQSTISVPVIQNKKVQFLFVVGLGKVGKKQEKYIENYRQAVGTLIHQAEKNNVSNLALYLPVLKFGSKKIDQKYLAKETAIATELSGYKFDDFITKKEGQDSSVKSLTLATDNKNLKNVQAGVNDGVVVAQAVNNARHWVDLPPNQLNPAEVEKRAKKIAKDCGLNITVFGEKQVQKMGMGGLAGVSAGSENDCKFIILEYKTTKKNAQTLAFVGKGITFDSGGLSLKPAAAMETMKEDMSGAAAVISAMQAIGTLKPDVNVIGLAPLAENLPGKSALMPGDIVRFYNGKTAEIKNTDAEGRLILADALAYATKHYKPDAMIDLATLTGACQYALGPFFSGLLSCDEELSEKIKSAANVTGDAVWPLPMDQSYRKAISSDVADICNIGKKGYFAGATTAAFFLKEFVGDTCWAHLDIAGTAFAVPDRSYYGSGATGAGVRLLIEIAQNWKK